MPAQNSQPPNVPDQFSSSYASLENDFADWARTQPPLRAALVIGSRARIDHPADQWSDLDLIVFTTDASIYTATADWLKLFGQIGLSVLDHAGRGDPEWLVVYENGLKIDIAFTTIDLAATPNLQAMIDASPYQEVIRRGVRVLFDKSSEQGSLQLDAIEPAPLPNADQFTALLHNVWLDALRAAKFIRRGDLWRAKHSCDSDLKQHLLTLLEWHTHAIDPTRDVWHDGRFIDEWGDPRVLARLPHVFARYDADDLWRALFATVDLMRWLSVEIADRLGYAYPLDVYRQLARWLHALRIEQGQP